MVHRGARIPLWWTQLALCAHRPAGEPLWVSLTAVITGVIEARMDVIAPQLHLKAASPVLAAILHKANEQILGQLADWARSRVTSAEQGQAMLQLNVATAATNTAFDAWQPQDGVDALLAAIRRNLDTLGAAFA